MTEIREMRKILFLSLGPYFKPTEIPVQEKYRRLSERFSGDILAVVNDRKFRHVQIGNFHLQGLYLPARISRITLLRDICYVVYAIVFCLRRRYDVVISGDPLVTGPLALMLALIASAQSVIEVNGNFGAAFQQNSKRQTLVECLKQRYSRFMIPYVLKHASGVKFLYRNSQLSSVVSNHSKVFMFPNFVPISQFQPGSGSSKYILFLGYPWFLKGVDILIKAFQKISADFPNYTLKVVGYCPDKTNFVKLAEGNPRIEFWDPVWYADAIKLMSECSLFVLPSRTEAMGRVLLEAMASKKPIIASNVDGIPMNIKHGRNGLLFESENVDDLAEKLRTLLADENYAKQLAENGYQFVHTELSEERYVERFSKMIEAVCADDAV